MEEADRLRYETQSNELRTGLKKWEWEFADSHNGSKPGRDDIKRNPKIASMYKTYNRVRDILAGKVPPTPKQDTKKIRKRTSTDFPTHTPSSKRFRQAETPSSRRLAQAGQFTPSGGAALAVTPSLSRQLFSPAVPTSIGPTPQRDGRVLGLFDLLPFKDAEIPSPSKPRWPASVREVVEAGRVAVQETPRKSKALDTSLGDAVKLGQTPSSRSKRHDQISPRKGIMATPLKRHDGNRVAKTPNHLSSVSKLQFQTPAFLRRIPMSNLNENSEYVSPEPLRLPRKPLLRGLSSVVADLRKMQEEQLDDDLDALREIEDGTSISAGRPGSKASASLPNKNRPTTGSEEAGRKEDTETILAEDSQKQNLGLLGGFDDEGTYDSGADDGKQGLDRDGKPLKVFKKKGQKRTTRRVNMRPVRARRPTISTTTAAAGDGDEDDVVPETQLGAFGPADPDGDDGGDPALLSGSEFAGSDDDNDEDELAQDDTRKTRKPAKRSSADKQKAAPSKKKDEEKGGAKPEGKVRKAARKVNELAHANFKRLKLRNSGAKGGPGYNSRFRRRR